MGEATLAIPPGALHGAHEVSLCRVDPPTDGVGDAFAVEVAGTWSEPLQLTVEGNVAEDVHLFVPGADGAPARAFDERRTPGSLTAGVARSGTVYRAEDRRMLEPYEQSSIAADLLFVIDSSGCSQNEQAALVDATPALFASLREATSDLHVGVTTTDMDGRSGPDGTQGHLRETVGGARWLDWATPDLESRFEALVEVGGDGAARELALEAAYTAIEELGDTVNAGFVRERAHLAVVVVTDEVMQTRAGLTANDYVRWFDGLKPDGLTARTHVFGARAASLAYGEVVDETGGVLVDTSQPFAGVVDAVVNDLDQEPIAWVPGVDVSTLEAWWFPDGGAEPRRFASDDVEVSATEGWVRLHLGDRPASEVFLLVQPR